jgi:hypothetical protein
MFRLFFIHRYWFVKFITVQCMICCLTFDFSKTNQSDLKSFCYKKLVLDFNKILSDYDLTTSEHTALTVSTYINPLTPNGHSSGRTSQLTSRRCILNNYSTIVRTEYFKHAA